MLKVAALAKNYRTRFKYDKFLENVLEINNFEVTEQTLPVK